MQINAYLYGGPFDGEEICADLEPGVQEAYLMPMPLELVPDGYARTEFAVYEYGGISLETNRYFLEFKGFEVR